MLWLVGCNANELEFDSLEGPTIEGGFVIPIGNISYTLKELIQDLGDEELDLQEDSSSLFYLIYRDTAEFDSGEDIINIEDVSNNDTLGLAAFPITPTDTTVTINTSFRMSYSAEKGEQLDQVFYSAGTATLSLTNNFPSDVTVDYEATLQGTKLVSNNSSMVFLSGQPSSQSLIGYYSEFTYQNDSNLFLLDIEMNIHVPAGSNLPPGSQFAVNLLYSNQEFYLLYGDFGQDTLDVGDQILDIKFFEDFNEGGITFGDPTLTFDFRNSFGIPLEVDFSGLYGIKTESPEDSTFLSGPITVNGPIVEQAENEGETETTVVDVDNTNSNIVDLFAQAPDQMGFKLKGKTNPRNLGIQDFVLDTSKIVTYIELNIPVSVQLKDLIKNVGFSLGSGLKFNELDSLVLRVITNNEMPFSANMDLEIYDQEGEIAFISKDHVATETPYLNTDGSLKSARKHIEDIPITPKGVEALLNGTKINLRLMVNSPASGTSKDLFVKILADYTLDIQLSAQAFISKDVKDLK